MRKKYWNGIAVKIILVFALFFIPFYALLLVSVNSYQRSLQEQAVNAAGRILAVNILSLESQMDSLDMFFHDLQDSDSDFISLYQWSGTGMDYISWYAVNRTLIDQESFCQYPTAFYVYMENEGQMLLYVPTSMDAEWNALKEQLQENHLADQNVGWSVAVLSDRQYLLHTTGYYDVYVGALIDMDAFLEEMKDQLGYSDTVLTVSKDAEVENQGYITVSQAVGTSGFYIHVSLNVVEIADAMPQIARTIGSLAALFVLMIPLLLFVFWHMIVKPIREIESALKHLGEGDQDYRIAEFQGANEFLALQESFNSMADEIKDLKIESYEKEIERERMHVQNLLLQIRPHFLLNMFNQIFGMAQLKDYEGIQKMSIYLAKYFRHLQSNQTTVPIRSELDVVKDYLEMMERRFPDCFEVVWKIDESLLEYTVPVLLIHNFVENIFKYAVSEENEIEIHIELKREEGMVVILITDDGPGMEPEILDRIRAMEPIEKKDGTHIGIWNSAYRLKTFCGENSRLIVESVLTEGTSIRIMLPCA